jgi:hypothetical protein
MPEFDEIVNRNDYEKNESKKTKMLDDIKRIIINLNSTLEGNCIYHHASLIPYQDLYTKQQNLFWCGKQANNKICEIGFNAGHSSLLMLLGRDNTPLNFTIFDLGCHDYTNPCVEYIRSQFQHIRFEYIEGDSTITIPKWIESNQIHLGTYDIVHVDGGHTEHCISNDMKNADILLKIGGILIIDDTAIDYINKYVDLYLSTGKYREMNVLQTMGYPHRIIQKVYN